MLFFFSLVQFIFLPRIHLLSLSVVYNKLRFTHTATSNPSVLGASMFNRYSTCSVVTLLNWNQSFLLDHLIIYFIEYVRPLNYILHWICIFNIIWKSQLLFFWNYNLNYGCKFTMSWYNLKCCMCPFRYVCIHDQSNMYYIWKYYHQTTSIKIIK